MDISFYYSSNEIGYWNHVRRLFYEDLGYSAKNRKIEKSEENIRNAKEQKNRILERYPELCG